MTELPPVQPVAPSELDYDLVCTRCGYNLRGLRTDGNCPECATPISRSVHGNLLRYADPDWVNKLRLGSSLMLWSIVVSVFLSLAVGLLAGSRFPQALVGLVSLVGGLLGLYAVFLLTTPEPTVEYQEDPITLRRVVRVCAVFQWLGSSVQGVSGGRVGPIVGIVVGLMLLVGIVSYFGMFIFLRRFALRVPDEKLAASTGTVMWGYVISMVLIVVGVIIVRLAARLSASTLAGGSTVLLAPGSMSGPGLQAGGCFLCMAAVGVVVFSIWCLILLFKYRRLFKQAAIEARETLAASLSRPDKNPGEGNQPVGKL